MKIDNVKQGVYSKMTSQDNSNIQDSLPFIVKNGQKLYCDRELSQKYRSPLQKCIDKFEEDFIRLAVAEELIVNPTASPERLKAKYREMTKEAFDAGPILDRYVASRALFLAKLLEDMLAANMFEEGQKQEATQSMYNCLDEFIEYCRISGKC